MLSTNCIRNVKGVRCIKDKVKGSAFCVDHINKECTQCKTNSASMECRTCNSALCGTCVCHQSFGR